MRLHDGVERSSGGRSGGLTRELRLVLLSASMFALACGGPPSTGGPDTGVTPCTVANNFCSDAGGIPPDGGTTVPPDAGTIPPDAGTTIPPDAGTTIPPDAGTTGVDSGTTIPPDAGTSTIDAGVPLCVWDQGNWDGCLWQ
jgi:hypothetical protein